MQFPQAKGMLSDPHTDIIRQLIGNWLASGRRVVGSRPAPCFSSRAATPDTNVHLDDITTPCNWHAPRSHSDNADIWSAIGWLPICLDIWTVKISTSGKEQSRRLNKTLAIGLQRTGNRLATNLKAAKLSTQHNALPRVKKKWQLRYVAHYTMDKMSKAWQCICTPEKVWNWHP